jgi:hypothetical protein
MVQWYKALCEYMCRQLLLCLSLLASPKQLLHTSSPAAAHRSRQTSGQDSRATIFNHKRSTINVGCGSCHSIASLIAQLVRPCLRVDPLQKQTQQCC